MKTLSLLQPWASLVVLGHKTIETRSWSTAHRGELLIHASLGKKAGLIVNEDPFRKYIPEFTRLPFGAIIGRVILEDLIRVEDLLMSPAKINRLSLEERAFGDYGAGRWAWILSEAEEFEKPIPIKGTLGLWEYEAPHFF